MPPPERAPSASLPQSDPTASEASRASLEAAAMANTVIGGSAADSKDNCDDDAITRGESQALVDHLGAVVPVQVDSDALDKTDAEAVPGSGLGAATGTAGEATTEPLGTGVMNRKEETVGGRGFSRKKTFVAKATLTPTMGDTEGARGLDGGVLDANVAGAAVSYTHAFFVGRESRGEGSKPEPLPAAATSVTSERDSVRVAPVLSLSGHLIGPEAMRGGGDGDGGAKNGCVEGWARDTFMREAVTWDDFARYPQV